MEKLTDDQLNTLIAKTDPGTNWPFMAILLELKQLRAEAGCVRLDTPNCRKPSRVLNKIR
jgi:hypothetical protein